MRLLLLSLFALGCAQQGPKGDQGEAGPPGERGPVGPAGPAGASPPRFSVWVDADGGVLGHDLVERVGEALWLIDPNSGRAVRSDLGTRYYLTSDCTGDAYVSASAVLPLEPRHDGTRYLMRPASAPGVVTQYGGTSFNGQAANCVPGTPIAGREASLLPVGSLIEVPAPSFSYPAPLHRELR